MDCCKKFVELDKVKHHRALFDCGEIELNRFIQQQAARHMSANINRTMVLPSHKVLENKQTICAFYSITPSSISRQKLPSTLAKKLPRYPIPVFLLAQLAVSKQMQGMGLGKITLVKALEHLYKINAHMRAYAVVVDCLNNQAESFYQQFGFEFLCEQNGHVRLFLSMRKIEGLFGG